MKFTAEKLNNILDQHFFYQAMKPEIIRISPLLEKWYTYKRHYEDRRDEWISEFIKTAFNKDFSEFGKHQKLLVDIELRYLEININRMLNNPNQWEKHSVYMLYTDTVIKLIVIIKAIEETNNGKQQT